MFVHTYNPILENALHSWSTLNIQACVYIVYLVFVIFTLLFGYSCHSNHYKRPKTASDNRNTNKSDSALNTLMFTKYSREAQRNRLVSQMLAPLAACREPARKLWQLCKVLYVFEHRAQYIFNPCSIYPHCGILKHRKRTPNDFVESNLL